MINSYLQTTENREPPKLRASHSFLTMANLRASQLNFAYRLVWMARPMPSRTIRSVPMAIIAVHRSAGRRKRRRVDERGGD